MKELTESEKAARALLDKAGAFLKQSWDSQAAHKLAVGAWWADKAKLQGKAKVDALEAWMATPSPFGANASAMAQRFPDHAKSGKAGTLADYGSF